MAKKYAMLIDLRRCVGCTSCQVSCKMENGVPVGSFRSRVSIADVGDFPAAKRHFLPMVCNQCDTAPCIMVCPVPGATTKREDGIVDVNRDLCIGCGQCIAGCPYGARYLHESIPVKNDPKPYYAKVPALRNKPVKDLRVVDKCDFCLQRLEAGMEEPACARNCFGKAIVFGDVNDPESRIAKLIKSEKVQVLHQEYGTSPRVYYIAADQDVFKAANATVNPA
jgi:Fe-S-cluster-containing dehydrogenase component